MSQTEATHDDSDAPKVNGVRLDSLDAVMESFIHLGESYNDGSITRRGDLNKVIITARGSRFPHLDDLLEAHRGRHLTIEDVRNRGGQQVIEVKP